MCSGESSSKLVRVDSDLTKKFKEDATEIGEDRISKLPDDLISDKILSGFLDSKFIISTGIISKRFQHLWKFVPYLVFSDESFCKKAAEIFLDFGFGDKAFLEFYDGVNRTLGQYRLETITKFQVDVNYDARFSEYVKNWIEFALTRKVKDFTLYLTNFEDDDAYSIVSESFYKSSDLTSLVIGHCLLKPNDGIAWKNLKKLTISNSRLEDDLIPNIVSGSPLLHTLILCDCRGYVIQIPSRSVEHLEIIEFQSDNLETHLQIDAPYITYIEIVDRLFISNISLSNVSSVVKAYLNLDFPHFYQSVQKPFAEVLLGEMLIDLKHAKEIKIGVRCYPIIRRMTEKGWTLPPNVVGVDTSSKFYVDDVVDSSESE